MTRKSTSLTIRDIAKYAGVSVATVSRYMNNSGPVSQEVGERISQVMLDLNFTPHAIARQLATENTRTVGLVITNVMNDFFAPLVNGIFSVTTDFNYNLLLAVTRPDLQDEQTPPPVGRHNTDGSLIFANGLNDAQLMQLCRSRFPMILLYRTPPPNLRIPCVLVENITSTQRLIDHLIEAHGRRRILFFRGPDDQEDSNWRELGYRKSLAAHGLPIDESLFLCGEFANQSAYSEMREYLTAGNRDFDGIFAGNDDAAVGILAALGEAGIHVPEQVSVVGFDDFRLSQFLNPSLTTVRAPTQKLGYTAARLLSKLFQGEAIRDKTLLPTELILRRSCGCTTPSTVPVDLE